MIKVDRDFDDNKDPFQDTGQEEEAALMATFSFSFEKPAKYLIDPRHSKRLGYWELITSVRRAWPNPCVKRVPTLAHHR
jgi:hypothetical protein